MSTGPHSISYDLAICRLGSLVGFKSPRPDRPLFTLAPNYAENSRISVERLFVKDLFRSQCDDILANGAYQEVFCRIAEACNSELRADEVNGGVNIERRQLDAQVSDHRESDPSANNGRLDEHLVAQFPPQFVTMRMADREWSMRIRASVTACAIEAAGRLPKLWWTFESVPTDPNPDNRPAEREIAAVLRLAESFEKYAFENLSRAYFQALQGKLGKESESFDFSPVIGEDKIRILFADSKSLSYETLIDAMGYQKLTLEEISDVEDDDLSVARDALVHFKSLVRQTVPAGQDEDMGTVEMKWSPAWRAVDAMTAVLEDGATHSKAIVGVAQVPVPRSSLDETAIGRDLRIADNLEERVRFISASRRVTARIAEIEAVRQEKRRDTAIAAVPVAG